MEVDYFIGSFGTPAALKGVGESDNSPASLFQPQAVFLINSRAAG
jgi:hypothetical protein